MITIAIYTLAIIGVLWYSLFFLPYTPDFSFALNIVQWGIVSLLSFLTFRQERHYRSIFFQFWVFFAAVALVAPSVYFSQYWFGGNGGVITYVLHGMIFNHTVLAWIVVNIVLRYIFEMKKV